MVIGRPAVVRRRPLLRAAAIGGTYAAGRAAGRRAQETAQPSAEQYQAAPPSGSAAGEQASNTGADTPVLDQLSKLTAMHDQGALTDEEFAAAKAKVLGS
jgi:hypothetical protein